MKQSLALLFLTLTLAACTLPAQTPAATSTPDPALVGTIAAQTLEAFAAQNASSTPANSPTLPATATPGITATFTATITPTYALPMLIVNEGANCRYGPGTNYGVVRAFVKGETAEIKGRSADNKYWVVKANSVSTCWIAAEYVTATGSFHTVAEATLPPTAAARAPSSPTGLRYNYTCVFGGGATVDLAWTDNAQTEQGYRIYRDGAKIAEIAADASTYQDTTPTIGTFIYKIAAYSGETEGGASVTAVITCQ